MLIRIEKYLSGQGILSRREAKKYIEDGLIKIKKKKSHAGDKINPDKDIIEFDKKIQEKSAEKISVLVYKPRGVLSSKDRSSGKNIFDVFPQFKHLNTVGRLDKESEGLIILSNDGLITKAITGKHHLVEKEYLVEVREDILPWMMKKMSGGIQLHDRRTLPAKAIRVNKHTFRITLKEGRKHQIRRMANECKLTIKSLKRIRIHTLNIGKMLPGNFRKLNKKEINDLKYYAKTTR